MMTRKLMIAASNLFLAAAISLTHLGATVACAAELAPLKVSPDRRMLVTSDGAPFFWLADTAWELFHRLDRDEAVEYLERRAAQGFNVVQAVAIAELDGHKVPNRYGHLPFREFDPAQPATVEGERNDYWDHVDFVVKAANTRGIYVAMLPTWGRYWHDAAPGEQPLFQAENAYLYGKWLGHRYRDAAVIWVLGGDRNVDSDQQRAVIEAMARGLKEGDQGRHLMTFHPRGGRGSSDWFHDAAWLDFNMRQNGHGSEYPKRYANTLSDYQREPAKPVIDAEPLYEDHPIDFHPDDHGHSLAIDVRRPLYWDLFGGAAGHTYGHHSVWQMWQPGRAPVNRPLMDWRSALNQPGANQMQFGRRLIESRPQSDRIPDNGLILAEPHPSSIPGAGLYRLVATRDAQGSYAMVYVPAGRPFRLKLDALTGERWTGWWFDPRTGKAERAGEFPRQSELLFNSPTPGESLDWVLVLDDAARNYPPPGTR